MTIQLEAVRPDWDAINTALRTALAQPGREAWRDLYPGGTGETLLEFMSAVGVYNQHGIESAFLETFLDTARRPTSVYALTRTLGTRISRKVSPSVTMTLSRPTASSPLVIPKWTEWASVGGDTLVNVEPIVFDVGQLSLNATLYSGVVSQYDVVSTGTAFQELFVSGSAPFSVSDLHLEVIVNNAEWKIITNGLWNYTSADRVVVDATTGSGDLVLLFGDDQYGTAPNSGNIITVRWLDTKGTRSAQLSVGTKFTTTINGLKATTIESQAKGGDEKGAEFYRRMAPYIYSERDKPVTPDGYTAKALDYPGVVDAVVMFQRDIDPYDLRMMNVAYASLLISDGTVWSNEVDTPTPPLFFFVENGSEYLAPATYSYRISAVNEVGESLACPSTTFITSTPGSLLLRWQTIENAISYRVYGRTSGSELFLAEVRPTPFDAANGRVHWLDDGRVYPVGALPVANTTQANWWTFVQWMGGFKHGSLRLIQRNPVARPVELDINVFAHKDVDDLQVMRQTIYERLIELFRPRLGIIGRNFALSDITTAVKVPREGDEARSYIDYLDINLPTTDQVVSNGVAGRTEYFYISSIVIGIAYTDRAERFS